MDITFEKGKFSAIMGPSGSGKSTLMHCMAALDNLTEGHALIGDTDLSTLSDKELTLLRRDRVGFIFQAFNLVPTLNAIENITLPMDLARREPDQAWVDSVIATVGLGDRLTHRPNELSGGQQQRVAVSRALASQPEIIFADEPTGNLDSEASQSLMDLFASLHGEGRTIVVITHNESLASALPRCLKILDGRLEQDTEALAR